ncbi:MAG: HlyD family efflux transporter periplasmic adaptor subunit, partial [Waterburya sp.]
ESTRETISTIPRVSLRAILYIVLVLAGLLIPWAMLAKVDEIGTARGRLEPKDTTITLDAPVSGTVKSIEAKEGQQVKKGEGILQLDSEIVNGELRQQQQKLLGQQNQLNQLQLLKNQQRLSLSTQEQQNQAQEFEKEALIEQAEEAITASESAHQTAKIRYSAAQEKVPRYRDAYKQGALSKDLLSEAKQQAEEYKESINQTAAEIAQARSRLAEQKRGLTSLIQTHNLAILKSQEEYKNTETQITTLQGEIAQTQSIITGLEYQLQQHTLYAPVAGTIFQLPIQKPGAVLQTGQMVAKIAPKGSSLVLRGRMSSRESGFLEVGLPVKLKFDAYPFQDYGIVPGKLTWISPDSRSPQTSSSNESVNPSQLGDFYEVEITLERNYIDAGKRRILLTPGHTGTAEVVIRQRRLVDVFLAPFKSLQKGGVQL